MLLRPKSADEFAWSGLRGWEYSTKEEFANASAAYVEVSGRHGRVKSLGCDRLYLILEGKGEFQVADAVYQVEKSDVVIVPKDTPYDYRAVDGVMKLFLVHCPAFNRRSEVLLEERA